MDQPPWQAIAFRLEEIKDRIENGESFETFSLIALSNLWLIACFLYYENMYSLMSDHNFDKLSNYLHFHYEDMREAGVYYLDDVFTREALDAGTGHHLKYKYPVAIKNAAFFIDRGAK